MACGQQIVIKRPNHQHLHTDITDFDSSVNVIINQTVLNSASANWNSAFNTVCALSADWATGGGTYMDRLSAGAYQAILDETSGQLIIPNQLTLGTEDSYFRTDDSFGLVIGGEGRDILLRPNGSEGNEFIFGQDNTLTFPDGSVQSTAFTNSFVHLSGDIMTGGLSAPTLSCNTLYVGASTIYFVDTNGSIINSLTFSDVDHLNSVYLTTNSTSAVWSKFSTVSANILLNGGNPGIIEIGSLDSQSTLMAGGEQFIELDHLSGTINIFNKALVPDEGTLAVYGTLTSTNFLANSVSANNSVVIGNQSIEPTDIIKWDSAYTTVNSNSASNWNYQGTDIKGLTANWQSNYSTTNANSANWELALYGYVAGQENTITDAGYQGTRAIVGGFDNDIRISGEGSQTIIGGNTNIIHSGTNVSIINSWESNIRNSSASFILGGFGNSLSGAYMGGIIGGEVNVNKKNNSFVIGSNITAPTDNHTFVNNLSSENLVVANSANFVTMKFTNNSNPEWEEGRIFYDNTQHTLAYYNDDSGMTVNVGQEQIVRVYNGEATQINNGQVVYVNGSQGNTPKVYLADANYTSDTSERIIGIATTDIPATGNKIGYITVNGIVHDVGTGSTAYTEGDNIYLSLVSGEFTATAPAKPNHIIDLGIIVGTSGGGSNNRVDIFVKLKHVDHLTDLCDVITPNISANDTLLYNSASGGYWYNYSTNNWQNTYTAFATQSANNISVYTTYQANSASSSAEIPGRQQLAFAWL